MSPAERTLCRLTEIADPGAKGFTFEENGRRREIFVVRRDCEVFAYENSCPHIGTPLDFLPDQFLTRDRRHLLCSTHGAMFEITTGLCIAGPCKGQVLQPLSVAVIGGRVVLKSG